MKMRVVIHNPLTGEFVTRRDGSGRSTEFSDAYKFPSWGAASETSQNLGPEWELEEFQVIEYGDLV